MLPFGSYLLYFSIFVGLFTGIFFLLTFFENRGRIIDPKPSRLPRVSIIVPAYNEEKTISKTIRSLLNVDYPKKKFEIIVVDDGSADRTLEKAKNFELAGVRVFHKENGGKASALNFGLERARGELVGALDADSFASRNSIMNMIGYFDNPEVMAVTPTLKIWKPKTLLQKVQMAEYLFGVFLRKVFSFMGSVHVTPGPLTIYRKSFFDKYGGYDEDNITEDIEVALRIQRNNYVIENSINASVHTIGPSTLNGLIRQRRRWYKGFLDNVITYRDLISPKHGNLGIFVLPAAFLSVALVISLVIYWAQNIFERVINTLSMEPAVISLKMRFFFEHMGEILSLYLVNPLFLLAAILILISLTNLLLAKNFSNEKGPIRVSFIAYILLYGILFTFWWSLAIFSKIFGQRVQW